MPTPTRLYKGGKTSGPVYGPENIAAWIADGWSLDPPLPGVEFVTLSPELIEKHHENSPLKDVEFASAPESTQSPRQAREAELMALYFGPNEDQANWRAIKAIADGHKITRPSGGWDEAIPLILDAEFPEAP